MVGCACVSLWICLCAIMLFKCRDMVFAMCCDLALGLPCVSGPAHGKQTICSVPEIIYFDRNFRG